MAEDGGTCRDAPRKSGVNTIQDLVYATEGFERAYYLSEWDREQSH